MEVKRSWDSYCGGRETKGCAYIQTAISLHLLYWKLIKMGRNGRYPEITLSNANVHSPMYIHAMYALPSITVCLVFRW